MEDSANPWQYCQKDHSDLAATQIACSENEYPRFACSERANLQGPVSQFLILREHNPAVLSDRLEPDAIFLVTLEVVIVNLDDEARFNELGSNRIYPE